MTDHLIGLMTDIDSPSDWSIYDTNQQSDWLVN